MKRITFLLAAALAIALASEAGAEVKCSGTPCIDSAGGVTSPISVDPMSATGVWTFDNAADTPVTAADGVIDSTLTAGRVTFAGAAGRLSDDADLTFATATLTGTNIVGGTSSCSVGGPGTANSVCLGSGVVSGEGSTGGDGFQTNVSFGDATADNQLQLTGTGTGLDMTATTGSLRVHLGTGTGRGSLGGVICKGAPALATTGTSEEILATCTVPANTLTADGSALRLSFVAFTAANGNSKRIRVRVGGIGGTIVYDTNTVAANNQTLGVAPLTITRLSATTATAVAYSWFTADGAPTTLTTSTQSVLRSGAVTWANANDVVITALTATSAGDATLNTYLVEAVQ